MKLDGEPQCIGAQSCVRARDTLFDVTGENEFDEYELRPFTEARLNAVADEWASIGGQDEFEVELGTVFAYHRDHLNSTFELFNITRSKTDALLDVVPPRIGGQTTKLLRIYMSPEFWPVDAVTRELLKTHISAYSEFIVNGLSNGVNEVKIYGRNDVALDMLTRMQDAWHTYVTGSVAIMQGRWLSITRS